MSTPDPARCGLTACSPGLVVPPGKERSLPPSLSWFPPVCWSRSKGSLFPVFLLLFRLSWGKGQQPHPWAPCRPRSREGDAGRCAVRPRRASRAFLLTLDAGLWLMPILQRRTPMARSPPMAGVLRRGSALLATGVPAGPALRLWCPHGDGLTSSWSRHDGEMGVIPHPSRAQTLPWSTGLMWTQRCPKTRAASGTTG